MTKHVRFRKSLASYAQGEHHHLPVELAELYIKAGVAELIDHVPAVWQPPAAVLAQQTPTDPAPEDKTPAKRSRKPKDYDDGGDSAE